MRSATRNANSAAPPIMPKGWRLSRPSEHRSFQESSHLDGKSMKSTPESAAESNARRLYAQDRASQSLGMQLGPVALGIATVHMQVRPDMTNGHGICHGGLIFALADSAF